jgi:hypothetical protein
MSHPQTTSCSPGFSKTSCLITPARQMTSRYGILHLEDALSRGGWLVTGNSYYTWRSRDLLRLVGDRVLVLRRALRGREACCTTVDAKSYCVTAGAMGLLAVGLSARHWPCTMLAFVGEARVSGVSLLTSQTCHLSDEMVELERMCSMPNGTCC